MINSKDMGDVSEWLKSFPNLKIVTRDGSIFIKIQLKWQIKILFKLQIDFI